MEEKKPKNILFIDMPLESNVLSSYEFIKQLISFGHNVTCYVSDELEPHYKQVGARLKTFHIDKNAFNKLPKHIVKRAVIPVGISQSYIPIIDDVLKSGDKYDFLIANPFFDAKEMNKMLKIPTVIAKYDCILGQKTPFVDISIGHRKHYWIPVNKKYNINIKDLLIQFYTPDADYKLMFTSKLFHPDSKVINDSFYFVGPSLYQSSVEETLNFKKDENKKLIYISLGDLFERDISFYKIFFEAFGDSKEYQVVINIGKRENIKDLGDIPSNFSVFNSVPLKQILSLTDVFISNGDINTIFEATFYNMPMIIIPQYGIQVENGILIRKYKAGIYLDDEEDEEEINSELIKKSVETYLTNKEKYKKELEKIAESFKEARNERKKILEKIFG